MIEQYLELYSCRHIHPQHSALSTAPMQRRSFFEHWYTRPVRAPGFMTNPLFEVPDKSNDYQEIATECDWASIE